MTVDVVRITPEVVVAVFLTVDVVRVKIWGSVGYKLFHEKPDHPETSKRVIFGISCQNPSRIPIWDAKMVKNHHFLHPF